MLVGTIERSLGASLAAENLRRGFDGLWYRSFSAQAEGLATTFDPTVVGIGAVFNGLDVFLRGDLLGEYVAIVTAGVIYLLMWTFFAGGFISIYANQTERSSFLAAAARYFPRFLVLALLAGVAYFVLFNFILRWLSHGVEVLTRDVIDERIAFLYTLAKYLLVWLLAYAINLTFDYSKILTVVRDHRNALTAPLKALTFVVSNLGKTAGLYLAIGAVWIGFMTVYWLIAPGAGQASWVTILAAFLLGQLYILSRVWTKCLFYGSETALYVGLGEIGEEILQ
jgi:hypothetical protein